MFRVHSISQRPNLRHFGESKMTKLYIIYIDKTADLIMKQYTVIENYCLYAGIRQAKRAVCKSVD